jgi:hypothetical protein
MNSEQTHPITRDEARSALDEIENIGRQTRRAIAAGCAAPMLILWGVIWIIGFSAEQYLPQSYRLWIVLDIAGIAGSCLLGAWSRKSPIKGPGQWRIGLSWLILFAYTGFWCFLVSAPGIPPSSGRTADWPALERNMAVLWVTVCMFAYMIMGLWLDRFLLWLGALVTAATLIGYFYWPEYFFLWMAAAGGGSLVTSGVFIRKYWK